MYIAIYQLFMFKYCYLNIKGLLGTGKSKLVDYNIIYVVFIVPARISHHLA